VPANVLVTGAAGFMGRHLVRRLAQEGSPVRALDLEPRPAALALPGVTYAQGDVRDRALLSELLPGVDTVFHLASVHLSVHAAPSLFRSVNVEAAEGLVTLCAGAGVRRIVHTSSVGVFGHVADPPATEDSPKNPQNEYERTKLNGERAALTRAAEVGMDVVVLRPAWVYGPGCPRTAKLLRSVRQGRFFYVGDGSNLRHPIFIDDAVEAYRRAAEASAGVAGRPFIVAGPRAVTLRELVESCARVLEVGAPRLSLPRGFALGVGWATELTFGLAGREPPFSRRTLAFFDNDNAFDTAAAETALGFRPRVDLEEGLRRTVAELAAAAAA
jgi:nucleoside-diphosphate-sugar epimerase